MDLREIIQSLEAVDRKIADQEVEIQNLQQNLNAANKKIASLQADIDDKNSRLANFIELESAFNLYQKLPANTKFALEGVFGAEKNPTSFLAGALQEGDLESLFVYVANALNNGANPDKTEIAIFLAGNSSKSKLVTELFNEYLGATAETDELKSVAVRLADGTIVTLKNDPQTGEVIIPDEIAAQDFSFESVDTHSKNKAQEIFGIAPEKMPAFKIYPALGTDAAHELQKKLGVEVNPNDIAAPTGKTGVAFGLLKCRDSGNVKITHITPNANHASFQFYVGRNRKRKFKPVIEKNTVLGEWYPFIDAGNSFDILYSDLPEAVSGSMDVQKARRVNVTLDECNPKLTVFVRAVNANTIEYQVAADIEDLSDAEKLKGAEPIPIKLA